MTKFVDARIPVLIASPERAEATDVTIEGLTEAAHPASCTCCVGRTRLAEELGALFIRRVRGEVAWFTRVLVAPALAEEARAALSQDPVVSMRYRLEEEMARN